MLGEAENLIDDVVGCVPAEIGIEGKAECLSVVGFCIGAFAFFVAVGVPVIGLEVDRDVEHLGTNAFCLEFSDDLSACLSEGCEVDQEGVKVPGNMVTVIFAG